jgi:hypothetical protein
MNPEDQSLYAEMRAAIRGDRERAEKRAEAKESNRAEPTEGDRVATTEPAPPSPGRFGGVRRLFGGRRDLP